MNILKYLWHIGINIVQLLIILGIFSHINNGFETLVMSGIILIYITLVFNMSVNGFVKIQELIGYTEEFIRLRIILKDSNLTQYYDNEEDIYKDLLEKPKETLVGMTPRFYVNLVFSFIIYIICLLNIIKTIS